MERRFTDRTWIGGGAFQGIEILEGDGLLRVLDGDLEGVDLLIEGNKTDGCGANDSGGAQNGESGDTEQGRDGV